VIGRIGRSLATETGEIRMSAARVPGIPGRRSFRIRSLMLVVAGVAAWLGLCRESPYLGFIVAILAGPTAGLYVWFDRAVTKEQGEPPGLLARAFLLCSAFLMSAVLTPIGVALIAVSVGMMLKLFGAI
jgi:hypothetical protein